MVDALSLENCETRMYQLIAALAEPEGDLDTLMKEFTSIADDIHKIRMETHLHGDFDG